MDRDQLTIELIFRPRQPARAARFFTALDGYLAAPIAGPSFEPVAP